MTGNPLARLCGVSRNFWNEPACKRSYAGANTMKNLARAGGVPRCASLTAFARAGSHRPMGEETSPLESFRPVVMPLSCDIQDKRQAS